jgi:hypothetical protein
MQSSAKMDLFIIDYSLQTRGRAVEVQVEAWECKQSTQCPNERRNLRRQQLNGPRTSAVSLYLRCSLESLPSDV